MQSQEQSRLLQLPMELQLAIFEYVVAEEEPLLLNCGCDSSYKMKEAWKEDQALWESGEKHPPVQPGLTRTCKLVRAIALPMYYQKNVFRAHYCYAADLPMAVQWLKGIGDENRLLIRDLALWDKNPSFDAWVPRDIKIAGRSDIVRGMGGWLEEEDVPGCCFHRVVFGRLRYALPGSKLDVLIRILAKGFEVTHEPKTPEGMSLITKRAENDRAEGRSMDGQ